MNIIQKILYSISWIPVILLQIFPLLILKLFIEMSWLVAFLPVGLFFLGLIIVPIAIFLKGKDSRAWYKIFWLWGNDEEGYPEWAEEKGYSAWHWYTIRNSVNNHRFIFSDTKSYKIEGWKSPVMEAQYILNKGFTNASRWSYRGLFAGYRKVWVHDNGTYSEFWIGWKVGSTVPGLGLTLQLRLKREIGK